MVWDGSSNPSPRSQIYNSFFPDFVNHLPELSSIIITWNHFTVTYRHAPYYSRNRACIISTRLEAAVPPPAISRGHGHHHVHRPSPIKPGAPFLREVLVKLWSWGCGMGLRAPKRVVGKGEFAMNGLPAVSEPGARYLALCTVLPITPSVPTGDCVWSLREYLI